MNDSGGTAPTMVRLPEELKRWIRAHATANRRSMSAQVVVLLEEARRLIQSRKPE